MAPNALEDLVLLLSYPLELFSLRHIFPQIDHRIGSTGHDIFLIAADRESPDLYRQVERSIFGQAGE